LPLPGCKVRLSLCLVQRCLVCIQPLLEIRDGYSHVLFWVSNWRTKAGNQLRHALLETKELSFKIRHFSNVLDHMRVKLFDPIGLEHLNLLCHFVIEAAIEQQSELFEGLERQVVFDVGVGGVDLVA